MSEPSKMRRRGYRRLRYWDFEVYQHGGRWLLAAALVIACALMLIFLPFGE